MPVIFKLKRYVRDHIIKEKPILGRQPFGGPVESRLTFVMVCRAGFNISQLGSNSGIRLGFCHGFAQIGVRYQLMSVFDVASQIGKIKNPFIFLSVYDYLDLNSTARSLLRNHPHFVWVNPWTPNLETLFSTHNLPPPEILDDVPPHIIKRVIDTKPTFVFAPVPPSCLKFYNQWEENGCRLESIPLACDTERYYPQPSDARFSDVKMAFVGLYRSYKNIQYEKYLRPHEDILRVYGFGPRWPYSGYGGAFPESDEKVLYHNARVCPALSEPHAELTGDIVERPFKIMGSSGLAITDAIPHYRELFDSSELLVPRDLNEYHEMVNSALIDNDLNLKYRIQGYKAVLERHTYAHRAQAILRLLNHDLNDITQP